MSKPKILRGVKFYLDEIKLQWLKGENLLLKKNFPFSITFQTITRNKYEKIHFNSDTAITHHFMPKRPKYNYFWRNRGR